METKTRTIPLPFFFPYPRLHTASHVFFDALGLLVFNAKRELRSYLLFQDRMPSRQAKYETHRLFRNPGDGGFLPVSPVARATALDPLFRSSASIRCHISCRAPYSTGQFSGRDPKFFQTLESGHLFNTFL